MNQRLILFALGMVCTTALISAAADDSASDGEQGDFPIVCFLGPPAGDNVREHWQRIKDAHFTIVLPSYQYDDADQMQMLDHCRAVGLKGIVNVKRLAPPGSGSSPPANWRRLVREAVDRYADHPALYGYMVRDEPGADLYPQLARVVAEFTKRDSRRPVCINLFPVHASAEQLQAAGYVEYLERYLETVKPPFLCYDHYPLLSNNTDRPSFFLNLELARAAGAKHKTPVWTVVLSGWGQHFRKPTAAELRWQVYSALAYGVKGLAYFAYWPTNDGYTSVVDYAGRPQPLYEAMRALNGSVLDIGRTLLQATSTAVYHTGAPIPDGCRPLPETSAPLRVPADMPLVIGLFERGPNERYAMIVNRDYRQPVTVPVALRPDVQDASIVWPRGVPLEQSSERHKIELPLSPGGAALLRLVAAR